MKECKYCHRDQIGDKYCCNDKCPYCSDFCVEKEIEAFRKDCDYKEVEDD